MKRTNLISDFLNKAIFKRSYYSQMTSDCLLGVGNPLLDYIIYVDSSTNEKLIKKFILKRNSPNIANSEQKHIFKYITNSFNNTGYPIVTAGGATQNSIRVAQWLLRKPGSTIFLGAVGSDKEGDILREKVNESNVQIMYKIVNNCNTGKCLIIVSGNERTLVTDFGASLHLNSDLLDHVPIKQKFELAKCIYLEGFLWITNPQLMINLAKASIEKILATNLHAQFLTPYFIQPEYNFLENVDILFGNQYEALALAKCLAENSRSQSVRDKFNEFLNLPVISSDALVRIALLVGQFCHNKSSVPRIIVFTQSNKEVILCLNGDEIHKIQVPKLHEPNIVDFTGCGDAFAGGFLADIMMGKSPLEAANTGVKMSQYMVTQNGCNILMSSIVS